VCAVGVYIVVWCGLCRSHDNSKFASSGGDRSIFLWDVTAGATTRRLPGHMGKINVVEFNEDSTVLASGKYTPTFTTSPCPNPLSGSYDATVRLWDLRFVFSVISPSVSSLKNCVRKLPTTPANTSSGRSPRRRANDTYWSYKYCYWLCRWACAHVRFAQGRTSYGLYWP
jgi:WD40 repeat protein